MSFFYIIFLSSTLLIFFNGFSCIFKKLIFIHNRTTKLSLAIFYKIKKFAIIEIILSNVTIFLLYFSIA